MSVKGPRQGGGERLQGIEPGEDELTKCIVAAADSAGCRAGLDEAKGLPDGIGARGAGVTNDTDRASDA